MIGSGEVPGDASVRKRVLAVVRQVRMQVSRRELELRSAR